MFFYVGKSLYTLRGIILVYFMIRKSSNSGFGLSPVIGVLLMITLTVILSAVVGSYVLDLADGLEEPPQAAVSFNERGYSSFNDTAHVEVVLTSAPRLDYMSITGDIREDQILTGGDRSSGFECGPASETDNAGRPILQTIGESVDVCAEGQSGTVRVIGTYSGSQQVLQTYRYDFSSQL